MKHTTLLPWFFVLTSHIPNVEGDVLANQETQHVALFIGKGEAKEAGPALQNFVGCRNYVHKFMMPHCWGPFTKDFGLPVQCTRACCAAGSVCNLLSSSTS
jgi:hypothetical protein